MSEIEQSEGKAMRTTPWVLDRTVNLPFLVTVAGVAFAAVLWAGKTDGRLANLERTSAMVEDMAPRIARMEERSESMRRDMDRLLANRGILN